MLHETGSAHKKRIVYISINYSYKEGADVHFSSLSLYILYQKFSNKSIILY